MIFSSDNQSPVVQGEFHNYQPMFEPRLGARLGYQHVQDGVHQPESEPRLDQSRLTDYNGNHQDSQNP
ncbi:6621_t:CDS:2 [Gigaspora rosea]|nr:6621_t:CDS:2 [Gigaspora rosea]